MKRIDYLFAIIAGVAVSVLSAGFISALTIHVPWPEIWLFYISLPIISCICLWLASLIGDIGKKTVFIFQFAKYFLVGTFATIFDLSFFEFIIWLCGFLFLLNPLIAKAASFIVSTILRYWTNKHWTFEQHTKDNRKKEIAQFFIITLVGLIINLIAFYYATNIVGPQFGLSVVLWTKLSVIFAAIAAALWNFLGYKFLVFKK